MLSGPIRFGFSFCFFLERTFTASKNFAKLFLLFWHVRLVVQDAGLSRR